MSDLSAVLATGAERLDAPIEPEFASRVRVYLDGLERWSRVARLTGHRDEASRIAHLVLDSLLWLKVLPTDPAPLLDVGTGPGVPGLILKLARPAWRVELLEASRRRVSFLRDVLRALGLEGEVPVHHGRAEDLGALPGLRSGFAVVTMRAVSAPERALALAAPFLRPAGMLVLSAGPAAGDLPGSRRQVDLTMREIGLSLRRTFLIIRSNEIPGDVPRGTRGRRGQNTCSGQPEGGRGQDDDRGEPGRRLRRGRAPDPPGRPRSPG